jgi:hypothetical protein
MKLEKALIALDRLEDIAPTAAKSLVPFYALAKWTWASSNGDPLTAENIEDCILNLIRSLRRWLHTEEDLEKETEFETGTGGLWITLEEGQGGDVDAHLSFRMDWTAYGGGGKPYYYSSLNDLEHS